MPTAETQDLLSRMRMDDRDFQAGVRRTERGVSKLEKRFQKIGKSAQAGARTAGRNIERGIALGVTAGAGALAFAVHEAAQQESAITGIAKTVEGDISGLTDELKKMATQIPLSFEELAGIAELGGAMGIAKDDLAEFTEQVAILGSTTNVTTEDAATALGQLGNVVGLTGDEFDNFAAALVDLGNKGASTEAQILEIAKRSGGAAKLAGVAKDEFLGWASAAANLGLGEELAGTALQKFFLTTKQLSSGKGLKKLSAIAGMTAKDFKRFFEKDATGAMEAFLAGLGKMSEADRINTIQQLYGKGSGLTRLLLGLTGDMDNLTESVDTNATAWEAGTAAQVEADKRFRTTESMMKRLGNTVSLAAATIGTELLPVIVELAQEGIDELMKPGTQKALKDFSKQLAQGARDAVTALKGVDWGGIANALRTAAGFAGELVGAFLRMPDWIKAAVLTGWGLNKLTGGALTDILGETIKIGFDQFLGKGSSPANPLWVASVQGGLGGGLGGGMGGMGLKGGLMMLGKFALGGALAGLAVAAVEHVRSGIADRSTEQGRTAHDNLRQMLKNGASLEDMGTSLRAVNDGIHNIESNPLLVLVQGEALDELKSMRGELEGAIEERARPIINEQAPRNAEANQRTLEGGRERQQAPRRADPKDERVVPAVQGVTAAINSAEGRGSRDRSAQTAELARIKGAIDTLPREQTKPVVQRQQETKNAIENAKSIASRENASTKVAVQNTRNAIRNAQSVGSRENASIKAAQVATNVTTRLAGIANVLAQAGAAASIVAAINALDLSVNVTTVQRTTTVNNRYGPSGGSAGYQRIPGAG